ncbi:MAG: small subunit ribosomal protein S8e [Candidatus Woesearchaeota archaeon]|nr:small subunit ribosomal protein S8e [Candidatus Woesearchaeota archaeon]
MPVFPLSMAIIQHRSKRKISGGKYKAFRKKRAYEKGNEPALTKLGKQKASVIRGRGGKTNRKLLSAEYANVINKEGKAKKVKILNVVETPANRNYRVRNIITKSAIIETEIGRAKVTSRPGQTGSIEAMLIEK